MDFEPIETHEDMDVASASNELEPQDYRVIYNRVHGRLSDLRRRGEPLPANLLRLERQLLIECISLSQGR